MGEASMDAICTLIEQEIPRMRRYARALLRNPVDADDLVQDAVVRALDKAHLWQPGTDLRAWLFTILHNQYVNSVRKSARSGPQLPIEAAATIGRAASQLASIELGDLKMAIERLPDEQRSVLLLVGLEGMSYDEVAQILKIPVGTVRSRLSRAREALRSELDAPERRPTIRKPGVPRLAEASA
jgi:RNA polymerase sigma-70 factor (ECF subfamily)